MATITTDDGQPVDYETRVQILMATGMSRVDAEFVIALEDGEIDGDIIEVEDGEIGDENSL